jgi:NAD(P)-dependent dehydrogenase (short-subunit alcohol dehydrogenase family)
VPHAASHEKELTLGPIEPGTYVYDAMRIGQALVPTGDLPTVGDPENDLGPTVAFLCSDDCRYLTGQTVTLDGGMSAFA